jgi:HK97 family phage portal protein
VTNPLKRFAGWLFRGDSYPRGTLTLGLGSGASDAGPYIGQETALKVGAVWSCVRVISTAVASLPAFVMQDLNGAKEKAQRHPLYQTIHSAPNRSMTASQWFQAAIAHMLLWGNSFTYIDRQGSTVLGLWPMRPDRMKVIVDDNGIVSYEQMTPRGVRQLSADQVLHLRHFTLDGVTGLSTIEYHRNTIGLGMAADQYAGAMFRNGGRVPGVLKFPNALKQDQVDRLRKSWDETHGGASNKHRVAILESGGSYEAIGLPPEDAQYVSTKNITVEDIARIFGVPPHLIGRLDKPTYASVEQQSLEFLQYTILPLVRSIEQSIDKTLLRAPYYCRFNLAGFLRTDLKSQMEAFGTARQWGIYSINDCLDFLEMNRVAGGDQRLYPLNMAVLGQPQPAPVRETGVQSE